MSKHTRTEKALIYFAQSLQKSVAFGGQLQIAGDLLIQALVKAGISKVEEE